MGEIRCRSETRWKATKCGRNLQQTETELDQLRPFFPQLAAIPSSIDSFIDTHYHYLHDVQRQQADIARLSFDGEMSLPQISFDSVPSLSSEEREKLKAMQPKTLNQMKQIPGITPNSLLVLIRHIRRERQTTKATAVHAANQQRQQDQQLRMAM